MKLDIKQRAALNKHLEYFEYLHKYPRGKNISELAEGLGKTPSSISELTSSFLRLNLVGAEELSKGNATEKRITLPKKLRLIIPKIVDVYRFIDLEENTKKAIDRLRYKLMREPTREEIMYDVGEYIQESEFIPTVKKMNWYPPQILDIKKAQDKVWKTLIAGFWDLLKENKKAKIDKSSIIDVTVKSQYDAQTQALFEYLKKHPGIPDYYLQGLDKEEVRNYCEKFSCLLPKVKLEDSFKVNRVSSGGGLTDTYIWTKEALSVIGEVDKFGLKNSSLQS